MSKNISLKLDKSNWKNFNLGDLAIEITDRVDKPNESNFKKFVSLDHFISGDIRIKNWQSIENIVSAAKEFKVGDILFARRNTYLKRASLVNFDGCCSGDAFVLREKHEKITEGLLVFLLNSSKLWDYAISNAAGTMSKRVKWRDLANYKVLLPSMSEQKKLLKLLWSMEEMIDKEEELYKSIDILFKAKIKNISNNKNKKDELKKIKEICKIKDNMRKPLNKYQRAKIKGEIPYYGSNGLVDYINKYIFDEELVLIAEDGGNFNEFYSKEIAYYVKGKSWVNNHAHVLSANTDFLSTQWLLYSLMHKNILKHIIGTTRLKLNKSELENIDIWIPSNKIMKSLTEEISKIDNLRKETASKINLSKKIRKYLINQIF